MSTTSPTGEYIYILRPTRADMLSSGPTPGEIAAIDGHWNYLVELNAKGIALYVGRTPTTVADPFGLVIFKADSFEQATALMNSDPGVQKDVMRAEVFPFQVFLREPPAKVQ